MSVKANELFRGAATYYSRFRPRYPEALFEHLAGVYQLDRSTTVADVGTGTGQIAIPLARRGVPVLGIDPQAEMLAEAEAVAMREGVRDRVRLVLGRGEDLRAHVHAPVRLVTLGQCFHWLERDEFLQACDAAIEPGGGVAIIAGGHATELHGKGTRRPAWAEAVTRVIREFLGPPESGGAWVCHEGVLARSRFNDVRRWTCTFNIVRNVDEIVGLQYSTSFCSPAKLGDRKPEFERVLRKLLLELEPSDRFVEEYTVEALCAARG